jgi:hypothetical protein
LNEGRRKKEEGRRKKEEGRAQLKTDDPYKVGVLNL